jgi:glycosyltransferase involved in cell wall biosynthesis
MQQYSQPVSGRTGLIDDSRAEPIHRSSQDSTTLEHVSPPWGDRGPRVSVVIPALNEEACLPSVLPRLPSWLHEVLLVDGESTDDTVGVARRLLPNVRIIKQQGRGKGAALRTGLAMATGDIIVMLDADGSTDPAEIPAFVGALLAGADFAKGSRFVQGAGSSDMGWLRSFGNFGFALIANALFRTRFSDLTYGYNAVWAHNKSALALDIDGWSNESISNIRVARSGLKVVEVASFERARVGSTAKLRLLPAAYAILAGMLNERFRGPQTTWASSAPTQR